MIARLPDDRESWSKSQKNLIEGAFTSIFANPLKGAKIFDEVYVKDVVTAIGSRPTCWANWAIRSSSSKPRLKTVDETPLRAKRRFRHAVGYRNRPKAADQGGFSFRRGQLASKGRFAVGRKMDARARYFDFRCR